MLRLQQEILFYTAAKILWKKIFQLAYENCEGCLFPHTIKHSCVFLWNTIYLKEHKWIEQFIENFYDQSFCELDWSRDFTIECGNKHIDDRIYKACYWQTRKRKDHFKKSVTEYIMTVALEEDDNLICQKLKDISCDNRGDKK